LNPGVLSNVVPGTYCLNNSVSRVGQPSFYFDYGPGPICSVSEGTFSVSGLTIEYPVNSLSPRLISFTGNFNFRCGSDVQMNSGTITFAATSTGAPTTPADGDPAGPGTANCSGGSGTGGGTGGGFPTPGGGNTGAGNGTGTLAGFPHPGGGVFPQPGTTTSTPAPTPEPVVPFVSVMTDRPEEESGTPLLTTAEPLTVPLLVASANVSAPVRLSATSDPEGLQFSFPTTPIAANSLTESSVTISGNPSAAPRDYRVEVTANAGGVISTTSFLVTLDCYPALIFGAPGNQPSSQSVQSGKSATLEVKPAGSGPFTYQWYRGSSGQTGFPIAGATTRTILTPVATSGSESYWVQVTNSCGSVDSATATVTTTP
ncbi:MAG: Alkaline phosphatase, partial [Acidobacteria bacterium]|nr:Alkaline phosphatase [Acidobacteriota bacterium]